jgi:hypothetical protein
MNSKYSPAFLAALVSASSSLVALILLRLRDTPGIFRDLPITLATLACGLAAVASLGVALIIARKTGRTPDSSSRIRRNGGPPQPRTERETTDHPTGQGPVHEPPEEKVVYRVREKVVHRVDPLAQYRAVVEMAWADEQLSGAEVRQLGQMELDLRLAGGRAEAIEREVMGGTREVLVSDDGPGKDEKWMELVEECAGVIKDLDRHMDGFDPARRDLADHVILSMAEGLERAGVDLILDDDEVFDNKRHEPADTQVRTAPGATITEIVSPGIAVGRRVLRKAQVRVE